MSDRGSPVVTIVVPVHNAEDYLEECVASALGQTFEDLEVVCIDDGSSDGSARILEQMAGRDPRVRVLRNPVSRGAGDARNQGLAAARGRYLRMLDADDILPAESTEILYRRAVETGADLVRGSLALFRSRNPAPIAMVAVRDRRATDLRSEGCLWVPWWHTSYLFPADLLRARDISYPNLTRGEDPVFLAAALRAAGTISLVEDVVYLYRKYPKTSGSGGRDLQSLHDYLTHATMTKSIYSGTECWEEGYGPILLDDMRRLLDLAELPAGERLDLERRMAAIWGADATLSSAALDPEEALRPLRLAAALEPGNSSRQERLAAALAAEGRYAEAEVRLRAALALAPADESLHHRLSVALEYQNNLEEASQASLLAAECAPDRADLRSRAAILLCKVDRNAEAESVLRAAVASGASDFSTYILLSRILSGDGRLAGALQFAREAIERAPTNAWAMRHLASLLDASGDRDAAEHWWRTAVEQYPADATLHHGLSQNLERQDRLEESLAHASKASSLWPDQRGLAERVRWLRARITD